MRHVWKGMIIGAFTGAIAGLGLEIAEGGAHIVNDLANQAAGAVNDRLPDAVNKVKGTASKAGDAISDKAPGIVESGKQADSATRNAVNERLP